MGCNNSSINITYSELLNCVTRIKYLTKVDKNADIKDYREQYEKTYKELLKECDNLKKLLDTVDPMDIDFESKIYKIGNLKAQCNHLHLYCLDEM